MQIFPWISLPLDYDFQNRNCIIIYFIIPVEHKDLVIICWIIYWLKDSKGGRKYDIKYFIKTWK